MTHSGLDYRDIHYFNDALEDQDALMLDIEIKRCVGLITQDGYPGEQPEVLRNSIFVRAEVKPISMGEVENHGAINLVSDLSIRCWIELHGSQQKDWEYGDKLNPATVADIIVVDAPYQGEWFVVGIPEPGVLVGGQDPMFWTANIRRIRRGALGK
jgi:hypothetical protein